MTLKCIVNIYYNPRTRGKRFSSSCTCNMLTVCYHTIGTCFNVFVFKVELACALNGLQPEIDEEG